MNDYINNLAFSFFSGLVICSLLSDSYIILNNFFKNNYIKKKINYIKNLYKIFISLASNSFKNDEEGNIIIEDENDIKINLVKNNEENNEENNNEDNDEDNEEESINTDIENFMKENDFLNEENDLEIILKNIDNTLKNGKYLKNKTNNNLKKKLIILQKILQKII